MAMEETSQTRFNYGVLKSDVKFIQNSENLAETIEQLKGTLTTVKNMYEQYASMTIEEKVRYDALCAFCVNSLFWMHSTLVGSPATMMNDIKSDLERVREAMKRLQMVHDSLTKRPRLDKGAAGRFVRAGLYDENEKKLDKKNNKKGIAEQDDGETSQSQKNDQQPDQSDQPVEDEQPTNFGKKKVKKNQQANEQLREAAPKSSIKKKKAPADGAVHVPPIKKKKNTHIRFD
uniref:Nuclear nucleic acid-binding protein C1D n=1 Tax=Anopheles farauti TaxID=69004 RepID=A0A182QEF6_9DIPT